MSISINNSSDRPITVGHGEYVVYHQRGAGEKAAPSRATFNAVYTLLNHLNTPATDDRYNIIRSKIKSIDSTLEITFVPRTYYELQFIKKCIKEDINRNDFCSNEHKEPNPYQPNNTKDCWHIAYFPNQSNLDEDNHAEAIKVLAFNMNQNLVKKIKKQAGSTLTFETFSKLTEKQIQFFRKFHDTFKLPQEQAKGHFKTPTFGDGSVLVKFSDDRHSHAMGIRNDQDAQIIRNAISLECHSVAEKAFLFYRGTDFPTDLPYSPNNPTEPYSFSFGPSLFAGALNCGAAAGFVYARTSPDGYVMAVSANDPLINLIDIPKKHTICHLSTARDVVFHPRTKIWKTNGPVWGFDNFTNNKAITSPYSCNLDRETLIDGVLSLKHRNVIFLKSARQPVMALPPAFQPTVHIHCTVPAGESLYIRGNKAGLNWQKGHPLTQIGEDHWIHRIPISFDKLEYKIVFGDKVFEEGPNHSLTCNGNGMEFPYFELLPSKQPAAGKTTRLTVQCNAGPNNRLTIRGGGAGLGWNTSGAPLKHIGADLWVWETSQRFEDFEYKLLINDTKWEGGPNHRAHHGKKEEVLAHF